MLIKLTHGNAGAQKKGEFAEENPKRIRISNTEVEFTKRKPSFEKAILMQSAVQDFFDSILEDNTKKSYSRALEVFEQYMGKTISEIIRLRREDFKNEDMTQRRNLERQVDAFRVWLIREREISENSAYSYITAIKSIMSFYDVSLMHACIKEMNMLTE